MQGKKYTDEFLEEVHSYMIKTNLGISAVAKHFKTDRGTLAKRLKEKYSDVISRKDGKLEVDSNYFKDINNERKAYWLGFFTADGYVSDNNRIELCLAEIDKKHVELFKHDIKSNHKISLKKTTINNKTFNAYRINITDKELANDLKKLGLNNKKSYTASIPKINNELMPHYIRGLFDGDGCVTKINYGRGLKVVICTTASEQMVDDITQYIKKELNIDIKYHYSNNDNIIDLCIYKQEDVKKFYNWIYKNATVYLNRKYKKFAVLRQDREKS